MFELRWEEFSGSDEAGVEGAGKGNVGGALDDGPTVVEEGKGVFATAKAEQEVVGSKVLEVVLEGEPCVESVEVDGAIVLMDLDRIATAECDVGAAFAGEVGEDAGATDGTVGVGGGGGDL